MAWVNKYKYRWYEKLSLEICKYGPVPNHVAFIMDGNRRYAKNSKLEKIDGHTKGFTKLTECLKWCLDIGVKEVTAFAFSIENFKRTKDEVDSLLKLAQEKFEQFYDERETLYENGVRIRIFGNLTLLPENLQKAAAEAMLMTENNNNLFLNIAFSYSSQDEITNTFLEILENFDDSYSVKNNDSSSLNNNKDLIEQLSGDDINEYLMADCLYTNGSSYPDLLIRTSGEYRMSDFLMWQLESTILYFTNKLWPDLTIWNFLYAIFSYQRSIINMKIFKAIDENDTNKDNNIRNDHVTNFVKKINEKRHKNLENLVGDKFKED